MTTSLLIIDPQNDFCDPAGALSVAGADADMARLAAMIARLEPRLDAVHVTLDSHHLVDIAHPIFWKDAHGQPPAPFTIISPEDVEVGRWTAARPGDTLRAREYVSALARHGRYPLCIWPPHCLIGSHGHEVFPAVFAALLSWERCGNVVGYVPKGTNIYTEHYSAIKADVPDPADPSTQPNTLLIERLKQSDIIAVAGEAGSHCVANTVRDLADAFGDEKLISKLVLLTDAVSPVSGFVSYQNRFVADLTARGMTLSTTTEFLER